MTLEEKNTPTEQRLIDEWFYREGLTGREWAMIQRMAQLEDELAELKKK